MSSDYPNPSNDTVSVDSIPAELPPGPEPVEIIAQPYYSSKLRYRSDYKKNKNRRGVLRSQNNPNYQSPAIRIPQQYLDVTQQYIIRVCLVTVEHERTKCRYIHPYDLEDIEIDEHNDRYNKVVWFPIQGEDIGGIKSFPNLRIVRKKADDLKNYGDLRVFDSLTADSTPQLPSMKDTIKEFNLEKAQLAFTIGQKMVENDNISMVLYSSTTIFSDEMIDYINKESDSDNLPSESTTVRSHSSRSSNCHMYKYAPRSVYQNSNDEVLIFYTNKLKPGKYGELQVTFECQRPDGHWSAPVLNLEVKDQMVYFKTPTFPFFIDNITPVNIILRQQKRILEPLTFNYIPIGQTPSCQRSAMGNIVPVEDIKLNKRPRLDLFSDDEETDRMMPVYETNSEIRESNSQPETSLFSRTTNSVSLSLNNEQATQIILEKLADSFASLFSNKDYIPILRICRPFIRRRPELLHQAIRNNHSDLLVQFIPIAPIALLQQKNQHGETVLLHAMRLNRVNIVKTLLEKNNSHQLFDDVNDKEQNIFHLLAINTDLEEVLELLIDHLLEKSINIQEKFDDVDEDNHTPLELAILNNNLSAIRELSKYLINDMWVKSNCNPNDLIQYVVPYDLA